MSSSWNPALWTPSDALLPDETYIADALSLVSDQGWRHAAGWPPEVQGTGSLTASIGDVAGGRGWPANANAVGGGDNESPPVAAHRLPGGSGLPSTERDRWT
jgi:hypothetical protein